MDLNTGRRGFLKFLGVGAAAAPAVPFIGPDFVQKEAGWAAVSAMTPDIGGGSALGKRLLGSAAWKLLNARYADEHRRLTRSTAFRVGVLEADIHAMRSWSPAFKLQAQMKRDDAARDRLNEMSLKLWPSEED